MPRKVPSGHGTKSSILYLHSPTVRPKDIFRLSGDPLIQDSLSINFTRFSIGSRSNWSPNKIIVVGIGKVTQFSIILSHCDKQSILHTSTQVASEKRRTEKGEEKAKVFKNHLRSGGEEKERRNANNVIRGRRVYDGYLVCLDLCEDLPGNGARNPSSYLLRTALVFP